MDSFHRSRARISFEVVCAFGISASLVAAWQQTYAPALLAAAGLVGLLGLVRAGDMLRRGPAVAAAEPRRPQPAAEQPVEPAPAAPAPLAVQEHSAPEEVVAPPAPKAPRKPRARVKKVADVVPPTVEREVVQLHPRPEPEELGEAAAPLDDESTSVPLAPLFEPEPFVRQQQRAVFGRKSGF